MFLNNSFGNVKKVSLFTVLLTQSMALQAVAPETTIEKNAATEAAPGSERQRAFFFPRWPQQKMERKERIPPPPPGPYMSSALSGSGATVKGPDFTPDNKPATRMAPPSVSMDTFSPDIPWPSSNNARSPERWKPESGYKYVQPPVKIQPYITQPNYNYGYPVMDWPGKNSNMMPFISRSVGTDQGRPYTNAPNSPATQYRQHAY